MFLFSHFLYVLLSYIQIMLMATQESSKIIFNAKIEMITRQFNWVVFAFSLDGLIIP